MEEEEAEEMEEEEKEAEEEDLTPSIRQAWSRRLDVLISFEQGALPIQRMSKR